MVTYLNGQFLPTHEAKLPTSDLGVTRGLSVFTTLRTYKKIPFHLEDHIKRLTLSAQAINLSLPKTDKEIREIIYELIDRASLEETVLKMVVTGGMSNDGLLPQNEATFFITASPYKELPKHFYTDGIKLITYPFSRFMPLCKSTYYLPGILALQKAKSIGAFEALYTNEKQTVLEGVTSNFFAFKKGILLTPDQDILKGITREVVLSLAKEHFPIEKREISLEELRECDEAFTTSSIKEILPVVQIDQFPIGTAKVGPKVKMVMELFKNYTLISSLDSLNKTKKDPLSYIS